ALCGPFAFGGVARQSLKRFFPRFSFLHCLWARLIASVVLCIAANVCCCRGVEASAKSGPMMAPENIIIRSLAAYQQNNIPRLDRFKIVLRNYIRLAHSDSDASESVWTDQGKVWWVKRQRCFHIIVRGRRA